MQVRHRIERPGLGEGEAGLLLPAGTSRRHISHFTSGRDQHDPRCEHPEPSATSNVLWLPDRIALPGWQGDVNLLSINAGMVSHQRTIRS
jgi:hypothetical protein